MKIVFLVVRQLLAPAADGRNDGLHPSESEARTQAVGIVALVERGELDDVLRVETFGEDFKGLARRQVERGQSFLRPRAD